MVAVFGIRMIEALLPAVMFNHSASTVLIPSVNDEVKEGVSILVVSDGNAQVKAELHRGAVSTFDGQVECCVTSVICPVSLEGVSLEQDIGCISVTIGTGTQEWSEPTVALVDHCPLT